MSKEESQPDEEPTVEDNEQLHKSSEKFRLKLIRDFRIFENLKEEEANLEAPKYHAQACELNSLRAFLLH